MADATQTRSMLLLLLTMAVWGSTFVVTKELITLWPPFTLALARVALGALVLLPLAISRHRRGDHLPWRTIWSMGFIGVALYYVTFNLGLVYVSASQGALVQASIPAMTALVAVLWLRERASMLRWFGIALSVAGVLIVVSGNGAANSGQSSVLGNALILTSVVCWGLYTAQAKRVAGFDTLVITAAVMGAGAVWLIPVAGYEIVTANLAGQGLSPLPLKGWLGILYLGFVASGLAFVLYNASLRHLDASAVGVYTNLIPVVGVLTGVALGDPLTARAIVGGLVVMFGVWITSRSERPAEVTA